MTTSKGAGRIREDEKVQNIENEITHSLKVSIQVCTRSISGEGGE